MGILNRTYLAIHIFASSTTTSASQLNMLRLHILISTMYFKGTKYSDYIFSYTVVYEMNVNCILRTNFNLFAC